MKISKLLIASASLLAVMGAQAQVTGALGGGYGPYLSLSSTQLTAGGSDVIGNVAGGTVYSTSQSSSDMPAGTVGNFLSAGPTAGEPASISFLNGGVDYVSFLWGSPDTYNQLTVTSTDGTQTFNPTNLGFTNTDGDKDFSQYVQFTADAGFKITGLSFTNVPATDAFETSNYSVTPVPEPETYALMLGGLGVIGFAASRRRSA